MLYTRKGDRGTSGLFGTKERFPKDSPIYEALGSLDELNSWLGVCRARAKKDSTKINIPAELLATQEALFIIQAELAGAKKTITQTNIDALEKTIDTLENLIVAPHAFIIPGATETAALYDFARALARRTERAVIGAQSPQTLSAESLAYLNRLSSFLYVLARFAVAEHDLDELSPQY